MTSYLPRTADRLLEKRLEAFGAVNMRKSVDDEGTKGLYILTGSSASDVETPHTGTLRISTLEMLPMSLAESGDSNGEVSLSVLFDDPSSFDGCHSDLDVDGLIFAICRGGWPGTLSVPDGELQLEVARDLFWQTAHVDISKTDGVKRNPLWAEAIIRSYARNLCTTAQKKTLLDDIARTARSARQRSSSTLQLSRSCGW